ncbi:MAG: FCD domain-containing protein [Tistlia sp.]|uniref:FadR/GntR family transcriptional regulator n=1 Tax=Tistlia sp. TaxID=3057121 RepID=UPI0034A24883
MKRDDLAAEIMAEPAAEFDLRRLRRPKKAELIADEIRRWIVRRQLTPGDRLPNEREMIGQLRSSRGTVREALKILEAQGLVEITPGANGGARVASIAYESASYQLKNFFYFQTLSWQQVYAFRLEVEPRTAALATPFLTAADFEALESTIERCRSGQQGALPEAEHRREEARFHYIIANRCPNPMLRFASHFVNDILADFVRYRNVIGEESGSFGEECVCAHEQIIKRLRTRDVQGVLELMEVHIRALGDFLSHREQIVAPDLLMAPRDTGAGRLAWAGRGSELAGEALQATGSSRR